jgi:hypothetical protein
VVVGAGIVAPAVSAVGSSGLLFNVIASGLTSP